VRSFRLTVAYDGTEFHGWQVQPGLRTVQGVLEEALDRIGIERRSRVAGAGRTDAGVHAAGQVASFTAGTRLRARAVLALVRRELPADVRVREVAEVEADFHARHRATARRYAYRLLWREHGLWERFAWCPPRVPDGERIERAVREIEGAHDFAAFQASGGGPGGTTCRVFRAGWTGWEAGLRFDVIADHFLYHMVRNIVGTALASAMQADPARHMRDVLNSLSRGAGGVTAPAQGLTLEQVFYGAEARA